jgi:hypothetical protein
VVPDMPLVPEVPPVVVPFMEPPDVVPLAAGPPAAELPPAEPPELCASAKVLVSVRAAAIAMVLNFMCRFPRCGLSEDNLPHPPSVPSATEIVEVICLSSDRH